MVANIYPEENVGRKHSVMVTATVPYVRDFKVAYVYPSFIFTVAATIHNNTLFRYQ